MAPGGAKAEAVLDLCKLSWQSCWQQRDEQHIHTTPDMRPLIPEFRVREVRDLATTGAQAGAALDLCELSQRPRWQWHDELHSYSVAELRVALTDHGTKSSSKQSKAALIEMCKVVTKPLTDA